jgi:hypothetical protein
MLKVCGCCGCATKTYMGGEHKTTGEEMIICTSCVGNLVVILLNDTKGQPSYETINLQQVENFILNKAREAKQRRNHV